MSSSAIARIRAAKASPAAMFAWTLPSKLTRSPVTATGRPTRVAPARAPGTAVVGGVVVRDPIGQRSGQRRHLRQVLVPGGDHDGAGAEGTVVGVQGVPVAGWCQPLDPHTGADGTVGGELLQSPDDLRGGCVGVMGLVAEQPVHPAGGVQPEGVPPLGAPALTGPAPTTTQSSTIWRGMLVVASPSSWPVGAAHPRSWRPGTVRLRERMLQGNHTASTGVSGQAP